MVQPEIETHLFDDAQTCLRGGQRTSAYPNFVGSRLNRALHISVVKIKFVKTQRKLHMLLLARRQRHTCEPLKLPHWLLHACRLEIGRAAGRERVKISGVAR